MIDFILSKASIDKIKNNLKISSEDIPIYKHPSFYENISILFSLKPDKNTKKLNNIDNINNGLILIEYIPCDKSDEELKFSIFEEEKNPPKKDNYQYLFFPKSSRNKTTRRR